MNVIMIMNKGAVGIFGILLSAIFCEIRWTKRKKIFLACSTAMLLLIQGMIGFLINFDVVRYLYPVITHVPTIIVLCVLSKKYSWSVISVFTAYLCCHLRRWLALLVVAIFAGDTNMQNAIEMLVTVPLFWGLWKYAAPAIRSISQYSVSMQWQFGVIPAVAYTYDYVAHIYTDWVSKGSPVVVEFMSFVCSMAYLVFVLHTSKEQQLRGQLEQAQENLNLQMTQAVREIELLRASQQQASTYRHDLRHHLQYLLSCMENGRLEQAQDYIHEICKEIEGKKIITYCENEAANLIFSSFAGRAKEQDILFYIRAEIPQNIPMTESDLCILLSNALENALHACQKQKEKGLSCIIETVVYEKNGKIFFQIVNSCNEDIVFEHGIPVTDRAGHGLGVHSICALVERYQGMYQFSVKDDKFILRVSI